MTVKRIKRGSAFLFVSYVFNDDVLQRYKLLSNQIDNAGNVFLLLQMDKNNSFLEPKDILFYFFNDDTLDSLDYEPLFETIIPGSNHFPMMQFYIDYPDYEYYWVIESNIIYTGNWLDLFKKMPYPCVDFLSPQITNFKEDPCWYWWDSLFMKEKLIKKQDRIKSFNPIFRISNKALGFLDTFLKGRENWGHHELLIPTVLYHNGYIISDFREKVRFVPHDYENKYNLSLEVQTGNDIPLETRKKILINPTSTSDTLYPVKSQLKRILSIIVTYNGENDIEKCIRSVLKSSYRSDILVIDNDSIDSTVKIVERGFPEVTVIKNSSNIGFGQANNIGLRYALNKNYDLVLLINQDASIDEDTLEELVRCHEQYPMYGILSPLHLSGDSLNFDRNFFRYIFPECIKFLTDIILYKKNADVYSCSFVNAAIWLLTKESLVKVGGFNPVFFHNGEDVDYVNRLWYIGLSLGVCPNAKAYHARENRNIDDHKKEYYRHKYILSLVELINPNQKYHLLKFIINTTKAAFLDVFGCRFQDSLYNIRIAFKILAKRGEIIRLKKYYESKKEGLFLY
ncbi:MAG: glycosyl transferase family 2 [Bacteroidetes bacterium]|nr:glycosyl transferase family 2 [Bacteroidota bacterium]